MSKLIRDAVPELVRAAGGEIRTRTVDVEEYARALRAKLVEEAAEAAAADDPSSLLDELGDVLEVVRELAHAAGGTLDEVSQRAARKRQTHGGFEGRLMSVTYRAPTSEA